MSKMIQIRNVPDDIHRTLKVRAAQSGMSLSDYLLAEITVLARLPTIPEWLEQVRRDIPVEISEPPEDAVRAERDSRY